MRPKAPQEVWCLAKCRPVLSVLAWIIFSTARPPPRCSRRDLPELHRATHAENPPRVEGWSRPPLPPAFAKCPGQCPSREVQLRFRVFLRLEDACTVDDGRRYGRRATTPLH